MKKIGILISALAFCLVAATATARDQVLQNEADVSKTISTFAPHEGFEALYILAKKNDRDKNFMITVTTVNGASKSKEEFIVPYGIFYPLYQKLISAGVLKEAVMAKPVK